MGIVPSAPTIIGITVILLFHNCFVLILEEILFLFLGFSFLAMFKFSRLRFRLFVARNIHVVVFLPISISLLLLSCWSVCYLCCSYSLKLFSFLVFFTYSLKPHIDASTLSSVLVSPFPSSFPNTSSLSMSSLRYQALGIMISFLILWPICWSSSFKNGYEYLTRGQPRC